MIATVRPDRDDLPRAERSGGALAVRIIDAFCRQPLRSATVEQICRDLETDKTASQFELDDLTALGVLRTRSSPGGACVYQLRIADGLLDVMERLTAFCSAQLGDVAISPERASLETGETPGSEWGAGMRSLRARVASLESANTMLVRKNLELSFLFETSALLAGSIDLATLVHVTLDAIGNASRLRAKRYFVALSGEDGLSFYGGVGLQRREADELMKRHRLLLNQAIEHNEVTSALETALIVIPISSLPTVKAQGCIVISEIDGARLNADELRALLSLAEMAARSLGNAALFSRSLALGVTDELTGVMNRRYLFQRLGEEVKRAKRQKIELSLIILDLDHFKSVNDRHGHQEGDRVLRLVAQAVVSSVRDIDIVTRFGGEEFAVILPGADAHNGYIIAERIRNAVDRTKLATQAGRAVRVAISCGVAPLSRRVQTSAQLIGEADSCLLEAKRGGRNRTVSAEM
ncbi:MAG: GGDEF domain-containing protein [Candidatus Eremiobacteraeota bacterium]|nr:GGDEF domain-containing protein [Candidatus Eremiobacteraeota bacterium]